MKKYICTVIIYALLMTLIMLLFIYPQMTVNAIIRDPDIGSGSGGSYKSCGGNSVFYWRSDTVD